ncbi:nucleotidyltransferase family protein [Altererythrobacter sp. MF3-039]|uniref:nucleotidyltransferase family protein n=1 Tax=Altererythrobacter sp. MF3-039 TaxID=3252901 RepID=UPI00390CB110
MTESEFIQLAHRNPVNRPLLDRLAAIALPDCFLVAGCLFQPVWNGLSGRDPGAGIKDYDVFYFDKDDLSVKSEAAVEEAVRHATIDLEIKVDVKNQARVHLWYEEKFGPGYPQLISARDGIQRYLVVCTCIGIEVGSEEVYAPFGFAEIESGTLRMNPINPRPDLFRAKARSYQSRWPWLTIVDPDGDEASLP